MRRSMSILPVLLLALCASPLMAYEPVLKLGVFIYDGANSLQVDRHSNPCAVDWNNDGAKDLVVGQYMWGYVWLYLNQGTNLNPVFEAGEKITCNGEPITTSFT